MTVVLFQAGVAAWLVQCFQPEVCMDKVERRDRFIEEALELTQACDYTRERAHTLVDYVFDRPAGDPPQEVGGSMVTLAALCQTFGIDMSEAALRELGRIAQPETMAKIRAKQAAKPTGSALPIAVPKTCKQEFTIAVKLPVRPELAAFAVLQESRLQDGEGEGDWKNDPATVHFEGLVRQLASLDQALSRLMTDGLRDLEANRAAVITEAVDIANMAMMVADVVGGLRASGEEGAH